MAWIAIQETQVQSLGQEDQLKEKNGYPLQYSSLENSKDRGAESGHNWTTNTFHYNNIAIWKTILHLCDRASGRKEILWYVRSSFFKHFFFPLCASVWIVSIAFSSSLIFISATCNMLSIPSGVLLCQTEFSLLEVWLGPLSMSSMSLTVCYNYLNVLVGSF